MLRKEDTLSVSDQAWPLPQLATSIKGWNEMKGFVAVIINMGIIQLSDLKDYWSTCDCTNLPFCSVSSRDRFFHIFGALHVGDIDESVITFKGCLSFQQYLKGKPNPRGIKAYVLADSRTGYRNRLLIYYGKETQLLDSPLPHTAKVVMTLATPCHNQGYDLYVNHFHSSPLLATELSKGSRWLVQSSQAGEACPRKSPSDRKTPMARCEQLDLVTCRHSPGLKSARSSCCPQSTRLLWCKYAPGNQPIDRNVTCKSTCTCIFFVCVLVSTYLCLCVCMHVRVCWGVYVMVCYDVDIINHHCLCRRGM